jgi:hypothetical protein
VKFHDLLQEDDRCRPLYEATDDGAQLVLTTWMLLDRLRSCHEDADVLYWELLQNDDVALPLCGARVNLTAERAERLRFELGRLLSLLWRSGLWSDGPTTEAVATTGGRYQVVRYPFTAGPTLTEDHPSWQHDLLGAAPDATSGPLNRAA